VQDGEKGHTGTRNTEMVGHINDRMHLRISLKSDREERENHLWIKHLRISLKSDREERENHLWIKATVRLEKTKYRNMGLWNRH